MVAATPASGIGYAGWRHGDWWSAGFRLLLLLVLVAGAVTVAASARPAERLESDLNADLTAGRVTYLDYDPSDHRVRWVNGWWRWSATTLVSKESDERPPVVDPKRDAALEWLDGQVDASGHLVPIRVRAGYEPRWWPAEIVWDPLQAATMIAWFGTFLIMLGSASHRYANRWAWFWLFTIGQAGVLLYLIMEPQPLWRPRSWPPHTGRAPARGGAGLMAAILLSLTVSLVAAGITAG